MIETKLIKSFILLEDVEPSKKGDIVTMRNRQAMIPISEMELYFENKGNRHTFSKKWLLDNLWHKAKPHEMFKSLEEKFEHIT